MIHPLEGSAFWETFLDQKIMFFLTDIILISDIITELILPWYVKRLGALNQAYGYKNWFESKIMPLTYFVFMDRRIMYVVFLISIVDTIVLI